MIISQGENKMKNLLRAIALVSTGVIMAFGSLILFYWYVDQWERDHQC